MNNKEWIAQLAQSTDFSLSDTQRMVSDVIQEMTHIFEEGDAVQVIGFGTFEVKKRQERVLVNPSTQQRMLVPPKLVLTLRPAAAIKDTLKRGETTAP